MIRQTIAAALAALLVAAAPMPSYPIAGTVQRAAPALDALIPRETKVERVAEGFTWSEGPVWVREGGYLLFSDVPENKMYRWREGEGASLFLQPSGYAGSDLSPFREAGSNGLEAGPPGSNTILVADSGSRAIARLDLATKRKQLLADHYGGKRFNSPNDLVRGPDGSIWFTDPPYGLKDLDASTVKELRVNGVYRLTRAGNVTLVEGGLTFPNGIALSPDARTLYVSNSDPKHAVIMAYALSPDGAVLSRRVFKDMTALAAKNLPGLPDGMSVDARGNLWASGPGGMYVFTPDGRELGHIDAGTAISNCAFGGADGKTLFMTAGHEILRLRTNVRGLVFP
ncbi:MAG TPA: SMP-30/gluconolactonase/LRE family protein [Allosphingosinicella sp.]|jgi:gluconolactonase|nr:SMP-30/gluconolactonase/LRE family protein [Allosphingosinicella sp.]